MITSVSNKKIKDLKKLKENKNIRKYKKYLIEGKHLIEEALKVGVVEEIIIGENFSDESLLTYYYTRYYWCMQNRRKTIRYN